MPRSQQGPSRRRLRVLLAVMALVVGMLAVAAPGAAADGPGSEGAQERRAQVLDYWTPQRVRSAIPRLPVVDVLTHHRPDHAGGPGGGGGDDGGGGGGGGGGTVTGAPWTGGSLKGQAGETTGKVLFTMGGNNYVCSGSTVTSPAGQSIVLTAGHCVHDGDGQTNSWASMWMFIPAYEDGGGFSSCGATTYGCWTASRLTTTGDWYSSGAFADDAGFAVMDPGGHSGTANLVDVVGAQSIAFHTVVGETTHAFGYPAAQKYKGDDLIYCAGTAVDGVQNGTAGLECDMTGGSSGGPWYADFSASETGTAVSVNSHIYRSVKNVMFGPVFDTDEQAAYQRATGAGSGGRSSS